MNSVIPIIQIPVIPGIDDAPGDPDRCLSAVVAVVDALPGLHIQAERILEFLNSREF